MSEQVEAAKHEYEIEVNTEDFTVTDQTVTYDQIVDLAYPNGRSDPNAMFQVDYEDAQHQSKDGELEEGGSIEVKNKGTVFVVIRSIRS
jgi:Multiubiquitin